MPKPEEQHIRNRDRLNPGTDLADDPLRSPNSENPPPLPDDYNAPEWAAEVPEPGAGKAAAAKSEPKKDDLDEYTVEGLHELASEMEIEGRSSMNRSELEKAIRKARK